MDESVGIAFVFFVGLPVFIGLVIWWQYNRTLAEHVSAAPPGWRSVGTDPTLVDRWHGPPFGVGRNRRVSRLMVGSFEGRPAMSFTYRCTIRHGKDERTYTYSIATIGLPAFLPTLQLTPEDDVRTLVAKALGAQDIQLESADFNRTWRVQAGVHKFAHDVLHPRTMDRLLRVDAIGLKMRIEGTDMICWASSGASTEVVGARLRVLASVIDGIPRHVWLEHGYDPGYGPGRA